MVSHSVLSARIVFGEQFESHVCGGAPASSVDAVAAHVASVGVGPVPLVGGHRRRPYAVPLRTADVHSLRKLVGELSAALGTTEVRVELCAPSFPLD